MADTYEKDLAQKSSLTVNDFIRVVGTDNVSYKQLVSDVAKKIIENYAGSSLAGSSQSVKSALDALDSRKGIIRHGTSLDTATTPGMYLCVGVAGSDNAPASNGLLTVSFSNDRIWQSFFKYNSDEVWDRQYWDDWKGWIKRPTRAEVDALKTYTSYTHNATVGSVSFQVLTKVYGDGLKIVQLSSTSSVSLSTSGWANAVSNYPISLTTIAIATGKGEIMVRTSSGALQINATDFSGYLLGTGVSY